MTATTARDVSTVPAIDHDEAMQLAETEYARFIAMIEGLSEDGWTRQTDCDLWDVKALVAHNLGNWEMAASVPESIRQLVISLRRAKRNGTLQIDEMTALQVAERGGLDTAELVTRLRAVAPKAIKARRRPPAVLRRRVPIAMPPPHGRKPLGYLLDTIFTRDVWMHRVDLSRATGVPMVLTAEHDGRLVADVVVEWARNHGQPCTVDLTGPAGGRFTVQAGGPVITMDAVEFCRTVSGRAPADGLLATPVLF